jgi:predicted deacetylase
MRWTEPIARALDARTERLTVFFRDDDAGWADDRLFALLDLFERRRVPVDLAAIPLAMTPGLARALVERAARGAVGLHQHGFAHANHEAAGRKCEFGASRSETAQHRDIASGRRLLEEAFGAYLDPIFTPPWNRCTTTTGAVLVRCGVRTISRDASAGPLGVDGLGECPVRLDWQAAKKGVRLSRAEWAAAAAAAIRASAGPLGVMFHHAALDGGELGACDAFLAVMAAHPRVEPRLMRAARAGCAAARGES